MLGRLQFGRIRRQEEQMDPLRNRESFAGMPASAVEDQQALLLLAGSHRLSKVLQGQRKDVDIDGGQE